MVCRTLTKKRRPQRAALLGFLSSSIFYLPHFQLKPTWPEIPSKSASSSNELTLRVVSIALAVSWLGVLVVVTMSDYLSRCWLPFPGK